MNERKVNEIEKAIKALEYAFRWQTIHSLPFETILKLLNDYIDLLERRKENGEI